MHKTGHFPPPPLVSEFSHSTLAFSGHTKEKTQQQTLGNPAGRNKYRGQCSAGGRRTRTGKPSLDLLCALSSIFYGAALGREITGGASVRLADWKKIKILFLDDNVKELCPWKWKAAPSTLATKVLAVITSHHHRLSFLRWPRKA